MGDVKAVSLALALLSGYTQPFKARSLLGGFEGYTTVVVRSQKPFLSTGHVASILRESCPDVKEIRLFASKKYLISSKLIL